MARRGGAGTRRPTMFGWGDFSAALKVRAFGRLAGRKPAHFVVLGPDLPGGGSIAPGGRAAEGAPALSVVNQIPKRPLCARSPVRSCCKTTGAILKEMLRGLCLLGCV